jgi:hypothetical protein
MASRKLIHIPGQYLDLQTIPGDKWRANDWNEWLFRIHSILIETFE